MIDLPWDAIAKLVFGLVVVVGGFFGIKQSGKRQARLEAAEERADDAEDLARRRAKADPTPGQLRSAARAELKRRRKLRE